MMNKKETEDELAKFFELLNKDHDEAAAEQHLANLYETEKDNPSVIAVRIIASSNALKQKNISEGDKTRLKNMLNADYDSFVKNFDVNEYKGGHYATIITFINRDGEKEVSKEIDNLMRSYLNYSPTKKIFAFPLMYVNLFIGIFRALFSGGDDDAGLAIGVAVKIFMWPFQIPILIPQLFVSRKRAMQKSAVKGVPMYLIPYLVAGIGIIVLPF